MSLVRTLRVLVVLEIALTLISMAIEMYFENELPPPLRDFIAEQASQPLGLMKPLLGALLLIGLVAGWIGLWHLKPWARLVYSIVAVIGFVATPFYGPVVSHGIAHTVSELDVTVGGMTLALIWLSPLAQYFRPPNKALNSDVPPSGGSPTS